MKKYARPLKVKLLIENQIVSQVGFNVLIETPEIKIYMQERIFH